MSVMFSIIVPIYKIREEYLRQCIESLIHQTFKKIEIHLIDDGSPDKCGQICDEYALQDNRIIVHHLKNGGLSYARNVGLKYSKGKYVIFLDADDWVANTFCDNMNSILVDDPSIDVICTCYCYAYRNGKVDVNNDSREFKKKVTLDREKKNKLLMAALYLPQYLHANISNQAEYSITMWGKVFRRAFLLDNQLKCVQGISPFEDNIFYVEMLNSNPILYFDPHISFFYRINEQSVTQRRLNHKYEIGNLSKTFNALKHTIDEDQLMALFVIMRIRQVAENIFFNNELNQKEKKRYLNNMRNDAEIAEQLETIQRKRLYQYCYKIHYIFYMLFYYKKWSMLNILFAIKKSAVINKKQDSSKYIKFE